MVNTTTAGLRLNGGSGNFTLQMFNNTGYQIDFANEVGPSVISANSANAAPGTMFNGTPSQADFVFVDFGGSSGNRYTSLPVQTVHVAGWSPQFPQSNAVMAVINDTTQTGNLSATNLTLEQLGPGRQFHVRESRQRRERDYSVLLELYADHRMRGGRFRSDGHVCERDLVVRRGGGGGGGSYTFRNNLTNTSGTVDFTPLDATVMNAVDEFLPSTSLNGKDRDIGLGGLR
jgi:hypothetical protein